MDDHDVPELGAGADGAAVRATAEDQAAAHPGPEREHDHVAVPGPAPARHSAIAAAFPSLSSATGSPSRFPITSRNGTSTSGMLTEPIATPCAGRSAKGCRSRPRRPCRRAARGRPPRGRRAAPARSRAASGTRGARRSCRRADDPGEDLRSADVDSDHIVRIPRAAGYHYPPDAVRREALPGLPRRPRQGEGAEAAKPERGGPARPGLGSGRAGAGCAGSRSLLGALPRPRRSSGRWRATSSSATASRRRTSGSIGTWPQALDPQHGSATDILLLGTDHAQLAGRESANRTRLDHARPRRHRASTGSPTSRSRATSSSRSPGTAPRRSTPRCSSAAPRWPWRR